MSEPFNRLVRIMGTFDLATGHADNWDDLLDSLETELSDVLSYYREALKEQSLPQRCVLLTPKDSSEDRFNRR